VHLCFVNSDYDSIDTFCVAKDVSCPYGLVFGGTDINVCGTDPHYKGVMLQAIVNARCVMV